MDWMETIKIMRTWATIWIFVIVGLPFVLYPQQQG